METIKKINIKLFLSLSLLSTFSFLLFAKNEKEVAAISIIYLVTIANLFMLSTGVIELLNPMRRTNNLKLITLFVGKLIFLAAALTLGVQIMGNRIIIPVLNYVFQIFIFILSFRRVK